MKKEPLRLQIGMLQMILLLLKNYNLLKNLKVNRKLTKARKKKNLSSRKKNLFNLKKVRNLMKRML
jgi:hypothetical protein